MVFEIENYASLQEAVESMCSFLFEYGVSNDSVFDSKLVAYELLGNVLKHADGKAKLQCLLEKDVLELKIYTQDVFALPKNKVCPEAMAEHGRGLFLVNAVCEENVFTDADGIRVQIQLKKK